MEDPKTQNMDGNGRRDDCKNTMASFPPLFNGPTRPNRPRDVKAAELQEKLTQLATERREAQEEQGGQAIDVTGHEEL